MTVKEAQAFARPALWYTFSILNVAACSGQTNGQGWQWVILIVILSKRFLRSEGSGRAARSGALFAPQ
jgi:hypothetical protein